MCAGCQGALLDLPVSDAAAASAAQVLLVIPPADFLILSGGLGLSLFGPDRLASEPPVGIVVSDLEADPHAQHGLPFGLGAIARAALEVPEPPSLAMPIIGTCLIGAGIRGKRSLRRERHANSRRRRIRVEHRKMALQA